MAVTFEFMGVNLFVWNGAQTSVIVPNAPKKGHKVPGGPTVPKQHFARYYDKRKRLKLGLAGHEITIVPAKSGAKPKPPARGSMSALISLNRVNQGSTGRTIKLK